MNRIAILLVGSVLLLSTVSASDDPCTDEDAIAIETPVATYYVTTDDCMPDDCLFSLWVYQESNGQPGLQRGHDETCDPESCGSCDYLTTDTIIF